MRWARSSRAAILATLLLGGVVFADPPADAPIAVHKGDPSPADGVWLSTHAAIEKAAKCQGAQQERDALRLQLQDQPGIAPKALWTAALVGLGLGLLAGLALGALKH